jgi:Flp pilus assembly pilin Flp
MQCGWCKEVGVEGLESKPFSLVGPGSSRSNRVENQVRGLLKNLGLVIGRAKMNVFVVRAAELIGDRPELAVTENEVAQFGDDHEHLQGIRSRQIRRRPAIEYGPIAAGISVAIIRVVNSLGSQLKATFTLINSDLVSAGK